VIRSLNGRGLFHATSFDPKMIIPWKGCHPFLAQPAKFRNYTVWQLSRVEYGVLRVKYNFRTTKQRLIAFARFSGISEREFGSFWGRFPVWR
jgi:hypothetical protein